MRYMRGWQALRADPQWISKVVLGVILQFVPLLGPIIFHGWRAVMLRRAVTGQDTPLPRLDFDFDYLGKLVNPGFKGFIAQLLWSLPMTLVVFLFVCAGYVSAIVGAVGGAAALGEAGGALGLLCTMFVVVVVIFPLTVILGLPMQMAVLRVDLTDDLNSAFRVGEVFSMTKLVFRELFIGTLVMAAIGFGVMLLGMAAACVGLYPAVVVVTVMQTFWHAEVYRVYLEKGGEPLPLGPTDIDAPPPHQAAPVQF